MKKDRRKELCDRFVSETARLFRLIYMGIWDDRTSLGRKEQVNQYKALILLADRGPMTVREMPDLLKCSLASVNNVMLRLNEKKMVETVRTSHDRRVVVCELASEGLKMLQRIDNVVRDRILPTTETWSLEQLEIFVKSLESIQIPVVVPQRPDYWPNFEDG